MSATTSTRTGTDPRTEPGTETSTETGAAAGVARRTTWSVEGRPTGFVADTWNVMVRELKPLFREPASVLFAMVQPLVFLGLFAPLLPEVSEGSALQWFVPGIIAMTALMGASMTGANLTQEIVSGSHERLLVSPLNRSSLLVGRALKEVLPMLMQAAIILAVVTPFSFDLDLGGALVGVAMLAVFSVGVGALSFALALVSKDQDWVFWTVQQTLIFPVLLLAGMLLPIDGAPGWLRAAAQVNPLTYIVEAERALFAGSYPAADVAQGFLAAGLVAALGLVVGLRAMSRSS
jgi:ABC-2 type transport system permease protein